MKVVGIDPSMTSTGVAVINTSPSGAGLDIEVTRVKSAGHRADTLDERMVRLNRLVRSIGTQFSDPDLVVIEGPAYAKNNAGTHDRSGLWWLVVRYMFEHELEVVEVPPTLRAKYATGRGNAGKDEVLAAVVRRYPGVQVAGNDDADALVLAAMGARWLGHPVEASLPVANSGAMDKVMWPAMEAA